MKTLVLGCGSFAGQAYLSHLIKKGEDVYGINRSKPKSENYWPWRKTNDLNNDKWYELHICHDTEQICTVIRDLKPNIIVDFMGQGMVAQSWLNPAEWYHTNITNKSIVLQEIYKLDSLEHYIRASTPEVYGSRNSSLKPDSCFNPSTPYAVSHAAIDSHVRCLGREYGLPYTLARYANFYGVGQQLYRVIPKLILCGLTGEKFTLDGGGKSLRSFIYDDDICSSIDNIRDKGYKQSEFHFSGDEEVSIKHLSEIVCNAINVDYGSFIEIGPDRKGKDFCYRLDCSESQTKLGWRPQISLKKGIGKVVDWITTELEELKKEEWNYIHKN